MSAKVKARRLDRVLKRSFNFEKHINKDPMGIVGSLVVWLKERVDGYTVPIGLKKRGSCCG